MNTLGEPGLNLPQTETALEYHKKFVELMPGESEYSTVNTLFNEGKAHAKPPGNGRYVDCGRKSSCRYKYERKGYGGKL